MKSPVEKVRCNQSEFFNEKIICIQILSLTLYLVSNFVAWSIVNEAVYVVLNQPLVLQICVNIDPVSERVKMLIDFIQS